MRHRRLKRRNSSVIRNDEQEKRDMDVTQKTGGRIKDGTAMVLHCFGLIVFYVLLFIFFF